MLECVSVCEIVVWVVLGVVVRVFLCELGVILVVYMLLIGLVWVFEGFVLLIVVDVSVFDVDLLWCFDFVIFMFMVVEIDDVYDIGDILGGVVEVFVYGVLFGFGSYMYWDCWFDL